ncbi:dihydrofolate reductase family protein [Hamadaea tsunoensis]|uniref:dihydrofolate reductase family protein n=1 Tax=Hamadaea tsunoensis TaxID=53368 RepID=UPI00040561A7|nr:dihydrofolate reductase family protein [Hamadaea tsunoensis]
MIDEWLLARYPRTPGVRINFVTSVDGAAAVDGLSTALSSPADKEVFRLLRMTCDALLVGAGTFRQEAYRPLTLDAARREWRVGAGLSAYPRLVVFSNRLDLDPGHPALASAPVRPLIVTRAAPAGHPLAGVADLVGTEEPVAALRQLGLTHLLCEGGPGLTGWLTARDEVDEVCLTLAPLLAGPGAPRLVTGQQHAARGLRLVHALPAEGALLLRYRRSR